MKGVSITYGDVAPGAKENFDVSASEKSFDTLENLQKYNMKLYKYANPCELYQTALDGTSIALPSDPETANIGLWSVQLSNSDGTFDEPITLTLESSAQYSSQGFTFTFDKYNDIYPTRLTIQWFRADAEGVTDLSGEVEFTPNSGFYFCKNKIDNFNKVIVKFYGLNMPSNRLKLEALDYGYGTVFYGENLRNVKLSQSVDPVSTEIKINTCDFTLDSNTDIEYSFQSKQSLSVSFNDELLATVFVKSSKRTAKFLWEITAEDYIGIMEAVAFRGGMYENITTAKILTDIFNTAKVPFLIDNKFDTTLLSGYIPYTTCREALMQVCFASMAVVNTANSDVVEVKTLSEDITQAIPLERIIQGQNVEESDTVTQVELTAHTYKPIDESIDAYKADDSGIGENIFVQFSEPLHSLNITNGAFAVDENGDELKDVNYAVINAEQGCILNGKKYKHVAQVAKKTNPKVLAGELENITTIESATLISPANINEVLDRCYSWFTKTRTVNASIVESKTVIQGTATKYGLARFGVSKYGSGGNSTVIYDKPVHLGDVISIATEYLGDLTGTVIEQSFNLNGNILVKETVMK